MQANSIAQAVLFFCLLVVAAVWDIRKHELPDTLCLLIALTGLMNFSPVNLLGTAPALLFFAAAHVDSEYVGGGDIKLAAAAGSVMGLYPAVFACVVALPLLLLYWGGAWRVQRKKKPIGELPRIALPLAPFLSCGFLAAYFMNLGGLFL